MALATAAAILASPLLVSTVLASPAQACKQYQRGGGTLKCLDEEEWSLPPLYTGGANEDGTCSWYSIDCVPPCNFVSDAGNRKPNPAVKPVVPDEWEPGDPPPCQDN